MWKLGLTLLLGFTAAFGQFATDTITITANRQINLQPDEIVFAVQVSADETAGIDDVLAKVPGAGITASNLTGVFSSGSVVLWYFTLPVPLAQVGATTALLAQLGRQSGQPVSFYVQGAQVSQALQQSQTCSQASLISDARTQAQNLAAAAGFAVGPALAVSDGTFGQQPTSFGLVGAFLGVNRVAAYLAPALLPSPVTCTAVVKFQLYRFH